MRVLGCFILFSTLAFAGAAQARLEDLVKQMLTTMDSISKSLESISDEDTAKAAHNELKKSASQWIEIRKQAEETPPPTKEEKERLAKEYKGKLEEAQKKLFAEIARVQNIPGGKDALLEIRNALVKKSEGK